MVFNSSSEKDTINIGKEIAKKLSAGNVIAFYGDLGVGKTHLISGIAEGLGFLGETSSPTFALVNEYIGGRLPLFHFDMYRVDGWEDLYSTGYFEYLEAGGVVAVEWSENIEAALPDDTIRVVFTRTHDNERKIEITGGDF